jgi:hypothetical protein
MVRLHNTASLCMDDLWLCRSDNLPRVIAIEHALSCEIDAAREEEAGLSEAAERVT